MLSFCLIGNTRVISQTALDHFRESLGARKNDPYSVLLKRNKLPMSLLDDAQKSHQGKVCLFHIFFMTVSLINLFIFLFASIPASAYRRDRDIQGYVWSESATQEAEPEH